MKKSKKQNKTKIDDEKERRKMYDNTNYMRCGYND